MEHGLGSAQSIATTKKMTLQPRQIIPAGSNPAGSFSGNPLPAMSYSFYT